MKKYLKNKSVFFGVVVITILVIFFGNVLIAQQLQNKSKTQVIGLNPVFQKSSGSIFYKGKANIDALTLLQQNVIVLLDQSGMVSSINGRKADLGKHEYWAFYINGKYGNVGPADYQTKNGDLIEWKVEKY